MKKIVKCDDIAEAEDKRILTAQTEFCFIVENLK